jgi:DNA-binding response OmpR family regulator
VLLPMNRGPRLLLVDDDDNDLTLFRAAVAKAGLPMSLAGVSNAQLAIDHLEHVRQPDLAPNVIVLDLRMPLKDGFDFLTWRKSSRFASVPVVILTGLGDLNERARALAFGANLVLEKPLKFRELVEVVRSIASISFESGKRTDCAVV